MSSQNEAHGDEDWVEISPETIHEIAISIICDADSLEHSLNDSELVAPLTDIMCCIDKACHGDPVALNALTRAGSQLKRVLLAIVDDGAYQIALHRQLNNE